MRFVLIFKLSVFVRTSKIWHSLFLSLGSFDPVECNSLLNRKFSPKSVWGIFSRSIGETNIIMYTHTHTHTHTHTYTHKNNIMCKATVYIWKVKRLKNYFNINDVSMSMLCRDTGSDAINENPIVYWYEIHNIFPAWSEDDLSWIWWN